MLTLIVAIIIAAALGTALGKRAFRMIGGIIMLIIGLVLAALTVVLVYAMTTSEPKLAICPTSFCVSSKTGGLSSVTPAQQVAAYPQSGPGPASVEQSPGGWVVSSAPAHQPSPAFEQGQTDRQRWETWFSGLTGDYRMGADYWAAHRSSPTPGSCSAVPASTGAQWAAGCVAAQQKLATPDMRRTTEADYRLGWNNPFGHPTVPPMNTPPAPIDHARAPQVFSVVIDVSVDGGAFPLVHGTTNLPDGTILWVSLWPPFPDCYGHCNPEYPEGDGLPMAGGREVTVKGGRFETGPRWMTFWPRPTGEAGLHSGTYILEVRLFEYAGGDHEPPNVRAIIGARGEYMRGPLVGACCFGYGRPGRAAQLDMQKELENARVIAAFYGPDIYYARYVVVP